jgi:hypothetical protein
MSPFPNNRNVDGSPKTIHAASSPSEQTGLSPRYRHSRGEDVFKCIWHCRGTLTKGNGNPISYRQNDSRKRTLENILILTVGKKMEFLRAGEVAEIFRLQQSPWKAKRTHSTNRSTCERLSEFTQMHRGRIRTHAPIVNSSIQRLTNVPPNVTVTRKPQETSRRIATPLKFKVFSCPCCLWDVEIRPTTVRPNTLV